MKNIKTRTKCCNVFKWYLQWQKTPKQRRRSCSKICGRDHITNKLRIQLELQPDQACAHIVAHISQEQRKKAGIDVVFPCWHWLLIPKYQESWQLEMLESHWLIIHQSSVGLMPCPSRVWTDLISYINVMLWSYLENNGQLRIRRSMRKINYCHAELRYPNWSGLHCGFTAGLDWHLSTVYHTCVR